LLGKIMPAGLCRALLSDAGCKAFHPALQNLVDDLTHANGNLKPLAADLADEFAGVADVGGLKSKIEANHQTDAAVRALPAPPRPAGPFSRCMPYSWFKAYNLVNDEESGPTVGGRDSQTAPAGETDTFKSWELSGTAARNGSFGWWTFDPPAALADDGQAWCAALALPQWVIDDAAKTGLARIEIDGAPACPPDLRKPTALQGFCADSKFAPDLTGLPHGRTKPDDPALPACNELIGPNFRYATFDATVTVHYMAYGRGR
jgi:hypothetical protein